MPISQNRCALAEQKRQTWQITPEAGTPFDVVLKPDYLVHCCRRMVVGDQIEVLPDDGSYYAVLMVAYVEQGAVKVVTLHKVDLADVTVESASPDYEIAWQNLGTKFAVIRRSDREAIKSGFKTKQMANEWLAGHMKALAA